MGVVKVGFRAGVYTTVLITISEYIFEYFDLGRSRISALLPVGLCDWFLRSFLASDKLIYCLCCVYPIT